MVRLYRIFFFSLFALTAHAQDTSTFKLYLIGDAGKVSDNQQLYKGLLQQQISNDTIPSAIVFLGDNIYPKGMPNEGTQSRKKSEEIMLAQLELVKGFKGKVFFVPGNHDWKAGGAQGLSYVLNQQAWVDSLKNEKIKVLPTDGCPGPIEVPLSNDVVLIVLNTQWWLHPWTKPEGETSLCECKTSEDALIQLDDILRRNQGKRMVVSGHHPLITYGEHGGYFSWKAHLFPFTALNKKLFIPLPVVGSLYPLYRKIFGSIQDVQHPQYKQFKNQMMQVLEQYPGVVYVSGHDHSLQYIMKDSVHYIVSGAGSKSSFVKKKGYAQYVSSDAGYVQLSFLTGTSMKMDCIESDAITFHKVIGPVPHPKSDSTFLKRVIDGTILIKASNRYKATKSRERWMGKNYRDVWDTEIEVPVFDFKKESGGLEILQRGGGRQTLSLRLKDSLDREYSLRSIEKFPGKALPEPLRKTFAESLVQDQISAAHPYGSLVIPGLAKAAGIYYTNPKVVFIPDDPRLGIYRKDFANQVMLFEERADGNGEGLEFFGSPKKMINSEKLLAQLKKDNDNQVDQHFFLKSRLFDMWIGDWDRHDDQWRWAEFETKRGKSFRPIPRDRDQAFFVNQGRIPKLLGKKFLLFQFEGFNNEIRWPSGLMFSGRYIDRMFLTELTKQDWLTIADSLAAALTDEAIDASLKQWPEKIYALHGKEIAEKLKARRANLRDDAVKHYLFLAKEVSIAGSDKRERFEIERKENGNVLVQIFKLNKSSERGKKVFEREFISEETKELRVYGLGGDDQFEITGNGKGMKIRVIGGNGKDEVKANRERKVFLYDVKNEVVVSPDAQIKNKTSTEVSVNEYNWKDYKYDRTAPLIYGNYNIDDGLFLGAGFIDINNGFRKTPFKSRHILLGSYAINTSSFNIKYDGRFTALLGKWDLKLNADLKYPNYVNNFFGWGNESEFDKKINEQPDVSVDDAIDYYRVRFHEIKLEASFAQNFSGGAFFNIGPAYQRMEIEDTKGKDRYINEYVTATPLIEESRNYGGVSYSWGIDKRNHPVLTTRGIFFEQNSRIMKGFSIDDFTSHNASLSFYQAFKIPAVVVFAVRAGGGINTGSYEFYNAQVLDGRTEIRGFRKTRFYGDSKVFFNNEVRIRLASIHSYLFPASLGILGFYDVGRVWYKNSSGVDPTASSGKSSVWHKGFGGGFWFTPFNMAVISTEVGHSMEGTLFYARLGFSF